MATRSDDAGKKYSENKKDIPDFKTAQGDRRVTMRDLMNEFFRKHHGDTYYAGGQMDS